MKAFLTFIGATLIVVGGYFVYDSIQAKQTTSSKVEREAASAIKLLSKNAIEPDQKLKRESDTSLIGGGIGIALGIVLIISGIAKKRNA
jgi:hypothetical protein